MSAIEENVMSDQLRADVRLVGEEFRLTNGVRAIVSAGAIAQGCYEPDSVYGYCSSALSHESNFAGFQDGYGDEDGDEGEGPLFGYGIPFCSYEAYLRLHDHFGENWLFRSLLTWMQWTVGAQDTKQFGSAIKYVESIIASAKATAAAEVESHGNAELERIVKSHAAESRQAAERIGYFARFCA